MGVRGAAVATLIARAAELLWAVGLSFRKNYIRPDYSRFFRLNPVITRDFFRCLLPLLGAGLLWGVGFTAYSAFMGHIDQDAPAANSVASSVIELVCCLCNGLASGGGILVGNVLGAGDLERGKLYGTRLVIMSYFVGIGTSLLMFGLTPLMMSVVRLNDAARAYLHSMMLVMSVYTVGRVINTITINGVFSAGGILFSTCTVWPSPCGGWRFPWHCWAPLFFTGPSGWSMPAPVWMKSERFPGSCITSGNTNGSGI